MCNERVGLLDAVVLQIDRQTSSWNYKHACEERANFSPDSPCTCEGRPVFRRPSRQAAVLHSTTSNFTSLAAAGEGGPSSSPLQCLVSTPHWNATFCISLRILSVLHAARLSELAWRWKPQDPLKCWYLYTDLNDSYMGRLGVRQTHSRRVGPIPKERLSIWTEHFLLLFSRTMKMETTFSQISAKQPTETRCCSPRTGSTLKINHREILDLLWKCKPDG